MRTAVFTVTLSKVSTRPVAIAYATKDGTATAGSDYTAVSGSLMFQPGQTSKQINVPIRDTLVGSLDEAFTVTHNLGTTDVQVVIRDSAGDQVLVDNKANGVNTVIVTWAAAQPNTTAFRVIVQG